MKKASVFTMLGLGVMLVFSSCTKDWTCTCTVDDGLGTVVSESYTIEQATKADAKAECDSGDANLFGIGIECELD